MRALAGGSSPLPTHSRGSAGVPFLGWTRSSPRPKAHFHHQQQRHQPPKNIGRSMNSSTNFHCQIPNASIASRTRRATFTGSRRRIGARGADESNSCERQGAGTTGSASMPGCHSLIEKR